MAAQLKAIFENAIDGLITIDATGTIEGFNPACERIFGYAAAEVVGQNIRILMPEPYRAEHDGYINAYHTTGEARIIGTSGREVSGRRKDGSVFPMDLSISRFDLADGTHFCGIIRDITDRKRIEKELRDTETRALAVFNSTIDGLITIDEGGTIESFNPACEAIFGYAAAEVVGQNIRILMPEPYHGEHDGYLSAYLKTGVARIIGTAGREVSGRRKDGTLFPMDVSISRFDLDDRVGFCGIIRDITQIKAEADNRQTLLNKLIESNTELERFAYVASHDMQEPIRMIANFSQIILDDYDRVLDAEGREYLHILAKSAERLQAMIKDLLNYARVGREGLSFAPVDLSDQIDHVQANLSEIIKESGAIIDCTPLPRVHGNGVQLMRLFQNLIANAIKYQPEGNRPHIRLSVEEHPDHWQFCLSDNGVGIEPAFHKDIFEPFRRLENWETVSGSGLGLAICRKIVENHDGRIWLDSAPGQGSRFYFTLSRALAKTSSKGPQ